MSISVPLAVTMMIGTVEWARIDRHTSMPDRRGSMRSRSTRSGSTSAKSRSASVPSVATVTSKPSRASPITRASTNDSSSSASSTRVWVGTSMAALALPLLVTPSLLLTCRVLATG